MGHSVLIQMFSLFQSLLQIGYGLTDFMDWSERTGTFLYLMQHEDLKEKRKGERKKKARFSPVLASCSASTCHFQGDGCSSGLIKNHHLYF